MANCGNYINNNEVARSGSGSRRQCCQQPRPGVSRREERWKKY